MSDSLSNFSIPVDQSYLVALGRAVYNSAYLEWELCYKIEKFNPGYLNDLAGKSPTEIGVLQALTKVVHESEEKLTKESLASLRELISTYTGLQAEHDRIILSVPFTDAQNKQRLSLSWKEVTEEELLDYAHKCEAALEQGQVTFK